MQRKVLWLALTASASLLVAGCNDDDNDGGGIAGGQISTVVNVATTAAQANDLRGLSFASVGANAGKVYVSGYVGATAPERRIVVGRFNTNGSADTTFSEDGFAQIDVGPGHEDTYAVAELASGDVVVAVNATEDAAATSCSATTTGCSVYLLRFGADGTQRTSATTPAWGDASGKVEVVFGWASADDATFPAAPRKPNDVAWDLQVDNSSGVEQLVVFGFGPAPKGNAANRTDQDRYVTRLSATNGSVDSAFNNGVAFSYDSTAINDNTRRGLVEADGKIVSSGYTNLGEGIGNNVILFRLKRDGTLDETFGGFSDEPTIVPARAGVALLNPLAVDGGEAEAYAVVRQSSGAYVTTGYGEATAVTTPPTPSTLGFESSLAQDLVTFRVTGGTSTSADTSWGVAEGAQVVQSEGQFQPTNEERGRDAIVLDDDRVVQVGRYGGNAAAFVFEADGLLDARINASGIMVLPHPTLDAQFFAAAVTSVGGGKQRIALTTNESQAPGTKGARLVVLETDD